MRSSFYALYGKRIFDVFGSVIGISGLSPIILLIGLAIKLNDAGPAFFTQTRIGKQFKPFKLIKFRTMVKGAESIGPQVTKEDDSRITRIGRFLRKTKIDELPQLLNVLKGDISLVGPRPEVPKYVDIFRDDYEEILAIRPGITDFSAIEFKDEQVRLNKFVDPEEGYVKEVLPEKIKLYKKYLSDMCFWADLKLVFLTLWKIA